MRNFKKIPIEQARELHHNYMLDPNGGGPTTAAVIINVKEAFSNSLDEFTGPKIMELLNVVAFDTLVCYFARYGNDTGDLTKNGRNTVIVHLANTDINGTVTVIDGEIYNFGDLKPPKTVLGQQIQSS